MSFRSGLISLSLTLRLKTCQVYVFDLMDIKANGGIVEMERPVGSIGFMLTSGLDEPRYESLWGIGYARKDPSLPRIRTDFDQNIVSPEDAAAALARHPEIRAWFERFFKAIGKPDELPPLTAD